MYQAILHPGVDTAMLAIPFVGMLLVGYFRLDEVIAAPRRRKRLKSPAFRVDQHGHFVMTDPDGQPWKTVHRSR
jgi:hypothetical protein